MRSSIKNLIPYDPGVTMEQLEKEIGKPIIKLSANESLWGSSPLVKDALQTVFSDTNYYPDGAGVELKEALGTYWNLPSDNFCISNGTDEMIFMLATTFLNPNDEVVIPMPTFSSYGSSVTIVGGKIKAVPQENLAFNLTELASSIQPETKMIFLCNPNNPTGTFFTHDELEAFLEKVSSETLVILDEAYCQYATAPQFPRASELLKKHQNLIVLRTFSKVYSLAALRVGYALAAPQVIHELEKVRQPYNVNVPAQVAAVVALKDEDYMQNVVRETAKEREWLTEKLRQLGSTVLPSQANFIMAKIERTHAINASLVSDKLLHEAGILVRNTSSFGLPDWLRISIGPHSYMEQLYDCLKQILKS